ncbi:MAG: DUF4157 domain-containing protein [Candidatus Gracilibacteria bacterium]
MKVKRYFIGSIFVGAIMLIVLTLFSGGRPLTGGELLLAEVIFGDSIDYDQVRIKSGGSLTWIYPGVTLGNVIAFPEGAYDETDIKAQALLLHELTHVWQYQSAGWGYVPRALYEEVFQQAYVIHYDESKSFTDYDIEEQGEIVAEYFLMGDRRFEVYIEEIQGK